MIPTPKLDRECLIVRDAKWQAAAVPTRLWPHTRYLRVVNG
jgi:hypothetical protein